MQIHKVRESKKGDISSALAKPWLKGNMNGREEAVNACSVDLVWGCCVTIGLF